MHELPFARAAFSLAGWLSLVAVSAAQPAFLVSPRAPLGSASVPQNGRFGAAFAVDGDTALVHAAGPPAAVYVFTFDGAEWTEQAVLSAGDAATNRFGAALALDGDRALIGAPDQSVAGVARGAVYEFVRENGIWSLQDTLIAIDGAAGDGFGLGIAIDGTRAVIGAPWAGGTAGTAHVFTRTDGAWTQVELPPGPVGFMGAPVAIEGDTIVAAAWDAYGYVGAVGVYELTDGGWNLVQTLTSSSAWAFGWSLALEGDTLFVGAPDEGYDWDGRGAVYRYQRGESGLWSQRGMLDIDDPQDFDFLGEALAIDGGTLALGAQNRAAVYLFAESDGDWTQIAKVEPQESTLQYGDVVALCDEHLLAAATLDDYSGNPRAGRAHAYRAGPDCNRNGEFDADDIAAGVSADCDADGAPDECGPDCNGNAVRDACELLAGAAADCNQNSVPDECDIAAGLSGDCNTNGRPDECDPQYFAESGVLSPIGSLTPQAHVFAVDSRAACEAEIALRLTGNFQGEERFVTVAMDGVPIGTLFGTDGVNCPGTPNAGSMPVAAAIFNAAADDGLVVISVLPSPAVDSFFCGSIATTLEIDLRYLIETSCPNSSAACERSDIFPADGDCVVDLSDVAALLAGWTGSGGGTSCGAGRAQGDVFPPGGDGCVDLGDLGQMLVDYGADCR